MEEVSSIEEVSSANSTFPTRRTSSMKEVSSIEEVSSANSTFPTRRTPSVEEVSSTEEVSSVKSTFPTRRTSSTEQASFPTKSLVSDEAVHSSDSLETSPQSSPPTSTARRFFFEDNKKLREKLAKAQATLDMKEKVEKRRALLNKLHREKAAAVREECVRSKVAVAEEYASKLTAKIQKELEEKMKNERIEMKGRLTSQLLKKCDALQLRLKKVGNKTQFESLLKLLSVKKKDKMENKLSNLVVSYATTNYRERNERKSTRFLNVFNFLTTRGQLRDSNGKFQKTELYRIFCQGLLLLFLYEICTGHFNLFVYNETIVIEELQVSPLHEKLEKEDFWLGAASGGFCASFLYMIKHHHHHVRHRIGAFVPYWQ
eukprot:g414.t1